MAVAAVHTVNKRNIEREKIRKNNLNGYNEFIRKSNFIDKYIDHIKNQLININIINKLYSDYDGETIYSCNVVSLDCNRVFNNTFNINTKNIEFKISENMHFSPEYINYTNYKSLYGYENYNVLNFNDFFNYFSENKTYIPIQINNINYHLSFETICNCCTPIINVKIIYKKSCNNEEMNEIVTEKVLENEEQINKSSCSIM